MREGTSEWEGDLGMCCNCNFNVELPDFSLDHFAEGNNDPQELRQCAPFAVGRMSETELRTFGDVGHEAAAQEAARGSTPMMDEDLHDDDDVDNVRLANDGSIVVNSLSYQTFRARLVEHFDILHRQNKIKRPERNKN